MNEQGALFPDPRGVHRLLTRSEDAAVQHLRSNCHDATVCVLCMAEEKVKRADAFVKANTTTPGDYLTRLQAEAEEYGWHKDLKTWVDPSSGVARVIRRMEAAQ